MLNSNPALFSIFGKKLELNHILIITILCFSFTISFLMRSLNGYFGWELNEFDPFFNYRATQFFIENGLNSYLSWNDNLSWYPYGRDISQTSQVFLHLFTGITYTIFNFGLTLYDYVIIFPVIIGSLTCILIFGLVRVISNTTAGLIASLLFSVSIPIIIRGTSGWFKSEPLGFFLGVLSSYILLSGLNSTNSKHSIIKLFLSSLFLIFALSSWGGNQFFVFTIGIFFIVLPFFQKNKKPLIWKISLFSASCLIFGLIFERTSLFFVSSTSGLFLIFCTIIPIIHIILSLKFPKNSLRNGILITIIPIIISTSFVIFSEIDLVQNVSYRYLNAVNPFLTTTDPLIDSIAEHSLNAIEKSFYFHTSLMILAGLGIWIIFRKNNSLELNYKLISFPLILGFFGVYISSAFLRLEIFSSLALIILASISISLILKNSNNIKGNFLKKYLGFSFIILFLLIPLIPFTNSNSFSPIIMPSTILNGGSYYSIATNDWKDTLNWINENTPKDSVIGSWWDYGYWIQTLANRPTISDNSTLIDSVIKKTGQILFMNEHDAWNELREKGVDYFVIFVSGERLLDDHFGQPLYFLQGGGDESKKIWFSRIAGLDETKYIYPDQISGTDEFWNNTLLGKMIPFEIVVYVNLQTQEQSLTYKPGMIGVYTSKEKFTSNDPFYLVYTSPSFNAEPGEPIIGVFVYKINENYVLQN